MFFCNSNIVVKIKDRYDVVQIKAEQLIVMQITVCGDLRALASILSSVICGK
jgi:hypothetical protein